MKYLKLLLLVFFPTLLKAQSKDSLMKLNSPAKFEKHQQQTINYKPEIFTSGFIDIVNNGQVNASARFIRLYIGEPKKIAIPLSFYSGVSSNSFQSSTSQRSNDVLVTNFINPLSGIANISIDGVIFFNREDSILTKPGILYHIGERVLTGIRTGPIADPATGKPINFLNTFGALGFYFQTGAWERSNPRNIGVCWFAFRYILTFTNGSQIREFLPSVETNGVYRGYSLAWGIDITSIVNIKIVYYKYTKKPEIDYFLPIYQFSFHYSLKK